MDEKIIVSRRFAKIVAENPDELWKGVEKSSPDYLAMARDKLKAKIDEAIAQFKAGEASPKRGFYKTKADLVQVTIRAGRKLLVVDGNERNVVRKENVLVFFNEMKAALDDGYFDAALSADDEKPVEAKPKAKREWSEESKAAHAEKLRASWERRKAEKAKAAASPKLV